MTTNHAIQLSLLEPELLSEGSSKQTSELSAKNKSSIDDRSQIINALTSNLAGRSKLAETQYIDREVLRQIISLQNALDPLTGLHSRASLIKQLQWRIDDDQSCPRSYALLFVDLDGFKRVNDSLGHITADALLIEAGKRLEKTVDAVPGSIVSRIGGDEFVVLMSDVEEEADAVTYAIALEYLLKTPIQCGRQQVFISASVGVAFGSPGAYTDAEQMLEDADVAMYRAKRLGKAQCAVFSQSMRDEAKAKLELEADLREAIRENQFTVHYQPKVRLGTGAVKGFEALLRWNHPTRGMVSPAEFLPLAEETGMISQIGRWVAQQAIQQLARWRRTRIVGMDTTMAVNVSTAQFHESDLLDWLCKELSKAGLPPECLVLEVTESLLVQDSQSALALLQKIVAEGIGLDLDDFGTGYSSLSYLHRFPFRCIKIDRSFVQQMMTEPQSSAVVISIVALARSLRMGVIAEGVETIAQAKKLRKMGCLTAQGYAFSRPKSAPEIESMLKEKNGKLGPEAKGKLVKFPFRRPPQSARAFGSGQTALSGMG